MKDVQVILDLLMKKIASNPANDADMIAQSREVIERLKVSEAEEDERRLRLAMEIKELKEEAGIFVEH